MERIFVFDPSLDGEMSHHYYAACAYRAEILRLGVPWSIVCHHRAPRSVQQLPAQPFFKATAYHSAPHRERHAEFEATALCNAVFFDHLLQLKRLPLKPTDFVFFPVITSNLVLGAMQWIASFDPAEAPRFGMCLMTQLDWHAGGDVSEVGPIFYRQAFECLPDPLRSRLVTTCETEGLADEYAPLVGHRPVVMPIPTLQHLCGEAARPPAADPPTLSFMGYAKPEKGFDKLPALIRRVQAERPEARFVVQVMGHDERYLGPVRDELRSLEGDVEIVEGAVQPEQMLEVMRRTHLMLLPYDAATYRTRGSAIFTECQLVGVPMLVPTGTAIAEEGGAGGFATTFERWDAAGVAEATLAALERLPELEAAAAERARAAAEADPGYLRALMQAGEEAASPPDPRPTSLASAPSSAPVAP